MTEHQAGLTTLQAFAFSKMALELAPDFLSAKTKTDKVDHGMAVAFFAGAAAAYKYLLDRHEVEHDIDIPGINSRQLHDCDVALREIADTIEGGYATRN